MGGGAPSIPQQNIGQELSTILQNLPKFIQKEYSLAGQYGPKFAQQDINASTQFAPQYAGLGLDISKQFAPQYQGLNLEQMQRNIAGQPLLKGLNQQANADLALGGQLSPQELRNVTQGTLSGFAARGNAGGTQALASEFLNRDLYSRQRENERRQFASQVQGLNLQQLSGLGGVVQPPNFAAYAAPGASYAPMAAGLGATSGQANSLLGFGSNLFDANQSAAANQAIGGANKSSGVIGGITSAVGTAAAAY